MARPRSGIYEVGETPSRGWASRASLQGSFQRGIGRKVEKLVEPTVLTKIQVMNHRNGIEKRKERHVVMRLRAQPKNREACSDMVL